MSAPVAALPGLQAVQSRLAAIQARFPQPVVATGSRTFEAALGAATATTASSRAAGTAQTAATRGAAPGAPASEAAVVSAAREYLGIPYVWGGTDPAKGLDCSGLVQRVYGDLGIDLPRVSRDQARAGTAVPDLGSARPGDLVAFGTPVDHIGIFIGDNKMIVAPKRGDVVKVQEIYREPTAIRRVLPSDGPTAAVPAPRTASSYDALFRAASQRTGVPAVLLSAVARAESGYRADAVSPAGARGLMQIMPGTARELGVDPMDPAQAVDGASRLLAQHLRAFGSTELALAAYNAGPGAVRKHDGVPPYKETQDYVQKVMSYAGLRP